VHKISTDFVKIQTHVLCQYILNIYFTLSFEKKQPSFAEKNSLADRSLKLIFTVREQDKQHAYIFLKLYFH